jgi:AraC-like DNA-binding protein
MADIEIQYAFPDHRLFDVVPAYLEVSVAGDDAVRDLLPPDMGSIRIALSGGWANGRTPDAMEPIAEQAQLSGPTDRADWIEGKGTVFCVGLHPLAWRSLIGAPAHTLANKAVPLSVIWPQVAPAFLARLSSCASFEERVAVANHVFLSMERARLPAGLAGHIAAIRLALADPDCGTVEEMAQRVRVNGAKLLRVSRAAFGFPPKALIRRERFRRMLHRVDAHSYEDWRSFIESQYVDQSHLIRDFSDFLGMSPSRYMALDRPLVAAAFRAFWAMVGAKP